MTAEIPGESTVIYKRRSKAAGIRVLLKDLEVRVTQLVKAICSPQPGASGAQDENPRAVCFPFGRQQFITPLRKTASDECPGTVRVRLPEGRRFYGRGPKPACSGSVAMGHAVGHHCANHALLLLGAQFGVNRESQYFRRCALGFRKRTGCVP